MHKTKLQIIARLLNHVGDLLAIIDGRPTKPLDRVRQEIALTEYYCRPYADCDDDELYLGYMKKGVILDDK